MRKRKVFSGFLAMLAAFTVFSMTALAEEEAEVEEIMISQELDEATRATAGGHGFICPYPEIYGAVYSNNTNITLMFHGGSMGNALETYTIRFYKGGAESVTDTSPALEGTTRDFPAIGFFDVKYSFDTTEYANFPEGEYTVVCTSYYEEAGVRVKSREEKATFKLEDYRRIKDREFVKRLYLKVFGREGDEKGVEDWTSRLFEGKTTGATTVDGFFGSEEFTQKKTSNEQYVELLYEAIFSRSADASGKQTWLNTLDIGVSRKYILSQFINSNEFKNLCTNYGIQVGSIALTENRDKNIQVTGFVNRLYSIALNRPADQGGINDWTGRLLSKKETPKQVARGFVFSPEMNNRHLNNTEFVTLLYRTMMDREPDEAGLKDWVERLDKGAKREDVYNGFADSVEFSRIVASYGL